MILFHFARTLHDLWPGEGDSHLERAEDNFYALFDNHPEFAQPLASIILDKKPEEREPALVELNPQARQAFEAFGSGISLALPIINNYISPESGTPASVEIQQTPY